MSRRLRKAKVTEADIARVAKVLRANGAKIAFADVTPERVRLVTTDGEGLTIPDEEATLDAELAAHRAKHGNGETQGSA